MKKLILTTLLFISTISTFTSCSSENEYQEEKLDQKAIATKEGQTIWVTSLGVNEKGEQVSEMQFEWTIKVRG